MFDVRWTDLHILRLADSGVVTVLNGLMPDSSVAIALNVGDSGHWVKWHSDYEDSHSNLSRRLLVIRRRLDEGSTKHLTRCPWVQYKSPACVRAKVGTSSVCSKRTIVSRTLERC
jgi:hypothetical protein